MYLIININTTMIEKTKTIINCNLAKKTILIRKAGHPWTNRGPFDQVVVIGVLNTNLNNLKAKFKAKFWKVWFCSSIAKDNMCDIVFYKPTGWEKEFVEDSLISKQIARNDYSFYETTHREK